jgi:hypothetical protein
MDAKLKYVAFCDVGDGNYLALNCKQPNVGSVFFLHHDYGFYPFESDLPPDAYPPVAASIEEWLERLGRSYGWDGTGGRLIAL